MADNLKWARSHFSEYNQLYALFQAYYDGRHSPVFSNPRLAKTFAYLLYHLRDNLCPAVCDSLVDRLQLEGLSSDGTETTDFLAEVWKANRMDVKAGKLHQQAITLGDAYLIAWPNEQGLPTLFSQKTPEFAVRYGEDDLGQDTIVEAVKAWQIPDGRLRVTRYLPEQIERYATKGRAQNIPESLNSLVPFTDDGQEAVVDNPFGKVPVFRFANGNDYASSELRDVLPLQNLLNKSIGDLAVASEFQALPQRWMTGAEIPMDPETGAPRKLESGPGSVWSFPNAEAKLGEFSGADLTKFTEVLNDLRVEIARVSRTPLHLLTLGTGDFPSGEALRTADGPLAAKVRDRQAVFGEVWEDIGRFCCQVAGVDPGDIQTVWVDTTPHSEKEQAEIAILKSQLGASKRQLLIEMGYSPAQIEQMLEEKAQVAQVSSEPIT